MAGRKICYGAFSILDRHGGKAWIAKLLGTLFIWAERALKGQPDAAKKGALMTIFQGIPLQVTEHQAKVAQRPTFDLEVCMSMHLCLYIGIPRQSHYSHFHNPSAWDTAAREEHHLCRAYIVVVVTEVLVGWAFGVLQIS